MMWQVVPVLVMPTVLRAPKLVIVPAVRLLVTLSARMAFTAVKMSFR